jgi:hypothetical protein
MDHRLSPRESRRLARRFQDERTPRVAIPSASGARRTAGSVHFAPAVAPAARGPYEVEYVISDGYSTGRTIILP